MLLRNYEDLTPGMRFDYAAHTMTAEDIIAFAREFDPQPFHLDADAGAASLLGGLAASGWHICAVFMRLMHDAVLFGSTSEGAPGMDEIRWRRPVLAGDTLSGYSVVVDKRLSRSRPGIGLVGFAHTVTNQHGEVVSELRNTIMFATRERARARANV